jgi:hypothetical protein
MEWMEGLSDELKGNESLKKFESPEALAKSYINLEARAGNSIRIVGPDASEDDKAETYQKVMKHMPQLMLKPNPEEPEQMKEFYSMLGVPEDTDGYEWNGEGLSPEIVGELRQLAKTTNMTKAQFKAYVNQMAEMQGTTLQVREEARLAQGAELKAEWGMAFEDRYEMVERFLKEREGLGSIENLNPHQIKAYYDIAKSLVGKPQVHSQPQTPGGITPSEARERIAEIERHPAYMSNNPADRAEHMRLIKKRVELLIAADPARYA